MLLEALQWGLGCALIGVVYAYVLPNSNTPLGAWYDFLARLEVSSPWLALPLGMCSTCFSGQLALWTSWIAMDLRINAPTAAFVLISSASSILIAPVLTKIYQWTQN